MDRFRLSLIVIGVLAVAVLFGGWALGIQPQLDALGRATSQTATTKQLNDMQAAKNASLAADNENLADFQAQLAADQAQIPESRSQQPLIDQINSAAGANGVSVESLVFDPAVTYAPPAGVPAPIPVGQTLVTIPTTITVTGPRPNLEAFAASLQSSTRIFSLSSSQYTGPDDSAVTLVGATWVMQSPDAQPAAATPTS